MATTLPAPAIAYLERWLAHQIRVTEQPGCAIAIAQRDELLLDAAFGYDSLTAASPLTPRHRFRVASHSKSFAAAGVMKLREAGRIKLDERVGTYLSGIHDEIAQAPISQVLSHTAGIFRDGADTAFWAGRAEFPNAEQIRRDFEAPPAIEANTRIKYSNHGFALIGLIVEAITGEPYATWLQREVIDAAGLTETSPDVPLAPGTPLAHGHGTKALFGYRIEVPGDQATHAFAPAAGIVSTAADLVRFYAQLAPNAKASIISSASRREMARAHWTDTKGAAERTFGLGIIGGAFNGWDWFGHTGGFVGYITRTATIPEHELTMSVLTNAADGMASAWFDGALRIIQRFVADGEPTEEAAGWSGRWWGLWGATDFVPVGDRVMLAASDRADPFAFAPELTIDSVDEATIADAGVAHSFGEPVRRERDASGAVTAVIVAGDRLVPEGELIKELKDRYNLPSERPVIMSLSKDLHPPT